MAGEKPIAHSLITEWQVARQTAGKSEDQIVDRITFILETWMTAFGFEIQTWYFDDAREGEVGSLAAHSDDDWITSIQVDLMGVEKPRNRDMVIIDKYGDEFVWANEIPARWLFEEFEKEIAVGKTLYAEKENARKSRLKEKSATKGQQDQELAEAAKAKLSPDELDALLRTIA